MAIKDSSTFVPYKSGTNMETKEPAKKSALKLPSSSYNPNAPPVKYNNYPQYPRNSPPAQFIPNATPYVPGIPPVGYFPPGPVYAAPPNFYQGSGVASYQNQNQTPFYQQNQMGNPASTTGTYQRPAPSIQNPNLTSPTSPSGVPQQPATVNTSPPKSEAKRVKKSLFKVTDSGVVPTKKSEEEKKKEEEEKAKKKEEEAKKKKEGEKKQEEEEKAKKEEKARKEEEEKAKKEEEESKKRLEEKEKKEEEERVKKNAEEEKRKKEEEERKRKEEEEEKLKNEKKRKKEEEEKTQQIKSEIHKQDDEEENFRQDSNFTKKHSFQLNPFLVFVRNCLQSNSLSRSSTIV